MTARGRPLRLVAVLGLAVAIGLATAVAPFAASSPDGLERVAQDEGFADQGAEHPLQGSAPAASYAAPGVSDDRLATGLAGFAGTLVVFAIATGAGALLRRRRWGARASTASS